ncbi:uncharacterized protein LOC129774965 [Toxorhynchites rutilus septentrionalis]|uniref:uncharacterized protein LOC129774965 n=1 Tax=Toxorhynchites rutilus septentrionalis TaxID=329112 RepID=UPI00247A9CF4|nr:uncharacterized protein LOC129774965 [Toxorhynchites rutilus septentrionalis]
MSFVVEVSRIWQKLAVDVVLGQTVDEVVKLLQNNVTILLVRFGLHTKSELQTLLDSVNQAIDVYCNSYTIPLWKPTVRLACELSGQSLRLKFDRRQGPIQITPGQRLYLASDKIYEDKRVENVIYVTNLDNVLAYLKRGDKFRIGCNEIIVCKIKGKFAVCRAKGDCNSSIVFQLHPYERLILTGLDYEWNTIQNDIEECHYAVSNNCGIILIPELNSHLTYHAIRNALLSYQIENQILQIFASIDHHVANTRSISLIRHLDGVITNDKTIIDICRIYCKVVLFEFPKTNQIPDDEWFHKVDVFIAPSDSVDEVKAALLELNRNISAERDNDNLFANHNRIFNQCIEYSSNSCGAHAIVLCTSGSAQIAEELSTRKLPCPMLVASNDENVLQRVSTRKYCIPVRTPDGISKRLTIKYATVYGKQFGYIESGSFVVTGLGEENLSEIDFSYVPDDFILSLK